ncbi:branched-chain amino acid ABC transporter substrate-binding protein [Rugosimonospora africana]|uniref:Branched-chain amino acid ABC transporter substrate-binding protein n=2 Tax=Rugosimonospora africana TaxID=556532 RepID=A0A8J3VMV6_9ACTN|nr:branched-chain amino acid ABC transporter substrate-binding protein [Rugosimonospora africana]
MFGTVATAVAACGGRGNDMMAGSVPVSRGPDLVVGACLDITGSGATVGTAQQRGLQIALDRINQDGVLVGNTTRRVKLLVKDTGSDPGTAVAAAKQMISGNQAVGLIVGGAATTTGAIAPVAEQAGVPLMATGFADDIVLPTLQRRFVFRLGPSASDVAAMLIGHLVTTPAKRVAVLATTDDHGDSGLTAVKTAVESSHAGLSTVATVRIPVGVSDYSAQAHQIVSASPDAVVIWGVAPASGLAARALAQAGYRGRLYFDAGAASEDTLSAANRSSTLGGVLVSPSILGGVTVAVTTPDAVAQQNYFEQYTRLFGAFSGLSIYGADALDVLIGAVSRAASTNHLKIRNGLESIPFDGLAGEYKFQTIQHGGLQTDSLELFQIAQDGWVQLT